MGKDTIRDPLDGSASKGGAEGKPFGRPLGLGRKQRLSAEEQATRSDMPPVK